MKVVQSKGSGWIDYMFPKPGQSQPSQKWSYVKAVNIDGTPGLVGGGFYPQQLEKTVARGREVLADWRHNQNGAGKETAMREWEEIERLCEGS